MKNKADDIADLMVERKIYICAITETWLSATESDKIAIGNLTPPGYSVLHVPRSKGRGGGVGIVYRENLKIAKQKVSGYKSFECMEVLLSTGNDCIRLSVIYRPPTGGKSGQPSSAFLEEFNQYVDGNTTTSGKLIKVSDSYYHYESPTSPASTWH